jgi:hypothetical protein
MNKEIKELAVQAGMIVGKANGFDKTQLTASEIRFAELIFRKCRDIVSEVRDTAIEGGWNVDEAMSTAMYDIDEYFGV